MSIQKKANLTAVIDDLLRQIEVREKSSEARTEPGGYQGASTHPSTKVDDRTSEATTGSRASENTSDVKADQGPPSVENTKPGVDGSSQESKQYNIGTKVTSTGENPSQEDDFKSGKDDPGSSHPARTDNESLDGHKYAEAVSQLNQLVKKAEDLGTKLLADIAVEAEASAKEAGCGGGTKKKPAAKPVAKKAEEEAPAETAEQKQAADAGYDLAGLLASIDMSQNEKQAADLMVMQTVADIFALADRRAEKAAQFYQGYFKAAAEDCDDEESKKKEEESGEAGNPTEGGSSDPAAAATPEGAGAPGGAPPSASGGAPSEEELMALLAGGQQMGAGDAMGAMAGGGGGGGAPPADPLAGGGDPLAGGGDPLAGGGGAMPPADPAAGGMPPAGDPAAAAGGGDAAALAAALAEMGIPLEQLQQLLAGKAASAQLKAAMWAKEQPRQKQAAAKPAQKPTNKAAATRDRIDVMKNVVREIIGR